MFVSEQPTRTKPLPEHRQFICLWLKSQRLVCQPAGFSALQSKYRILLIVRTGKSLTQCVCVCTCVFKNSSHTQNMFQTHLPNKCLFYVAEMRALENHAFAVFYFWSKNAECQPTYVKERTNVFLKRMRAFQNILGLYNCLSVCLHGFLF